MRRTSGLLLILLIASLLAACTPPAGSPAIPSAEIPASSVPPGDTPAAIVIRPTNTPVPSDTPSRAVVRAILPPPTRTPPPAPPLPATPRAGSALPTAADLGIVTPPPAPTRIPPPTQIPVPAPIIRTLETSSQTVDALALALREALVPLTWVVENRPPGSNLLFEQVFPDSRVARVDLPRWFTEVPSTGQGDVAPYLPAGDTAEIVLRVRLVDTGGGTLTSRELRLPVANRPGAGYMVTAPAACYDLPYLPSSGLAIGTRGVAGSNLYGPLPLTSVGGVGGRIVGSVDLDEGFTVLDGPFCFRPPGRDADYTVRQWKVRPERSGAEGWVVEYSGTPRRYTQTIFPVRRDVVYDAAACTSAPFLPDRGIRVGYGARLSASMVGGMAMMADVATRVSAVVAGGGLQPDEVFTVIEGPFCYRSEPAPDSAIGYRQWRVRSERTGLSGWVFEYSDQRQAYIEPAGGGTPIPGGGTGLEIAAFDVQPRTVAAGAPLTITWDVRGANGVVILMWYAGLADGKVPLNGGALLPNSGSLTVAAPSGVTSARFTIFEQPEPTAGVTVTIACATSWFAASPSPFCPSEPARSVQAAYQPFERGFMIWYEGRIGVFTPGGAGLAFFPDTWAGGDVAYSEPPPAGLLQPVRGFGTLWVSDSGVREALGWATAPEQGYTIRVQEAPMMRRPGMHGGYDAADRLISLPDGRILSLTVTGAGYFSWQPAG